MARHMAWALAALLLLGAAGPARAQASSGSHGSTSAHEGQRPKKWWVDPQMRAELGITDAESTAVEQVWQATIPRLRQLREQLDEGDKTLSQMIRDAVDENSLMAELDKVESIRSESNKARTLMLYRMNLVLSPDQRVKLRAMWERLEQSRRGSDHRHP